MTTRQVKQYRSIFNKFLNFHRGKDRINLLTQDSLNEYLEALRNAGYKTTSRRFHYNAIRHYFLRYGIEPSWIFRIDKDEALRPTFTKEEILIIIEVAKSLGIAYTTPIAISTIYGIRRAELLTFKEGDLDIKKKTLKIRPVKGGEITTHYLPDNIIPYLDLSKLRMSLSSLSLLFNQVAEIAKVKTDRTGWHSVRRAVVTGLIDNGVSSEDVQRFMRWSRPDMVNIYYAYSPEKDKKIFEKHPFLSMW